jgi:hypothetical protein
MDPLGVFNENIYKQGFKSLLLHPSNQSSLHLMWKGLNNLVGLSFLFACYFGQLEVGPRNVCIK